VARAARRSMKLSVSNALFAILLLGMIGTVGELLLLGHTEDLRQWIPLILLGTGLLVSLWYAHDSSARSANVLRTILIGYILSGLAGIYFHYQGSAEFKLESNPRLAGWALFREAIGAKAPPLLAPGAMVQLGLLGLVYVQLHAARGRRFDKGEKHA
jgi:hypothetical protein